MERIYIDEKGNVIENPDWEVSFMDYAEEVDGKLICHCRRLTEEEIAAFAQMKYEALQHEQVLSAISILLTDRNLTDKQAAIVYTLYPKWSIGESYKTGDIRLYENELYRALQDSKSTTEFPPDASTALWKHIEKPNEEGIFPWVQPLGATDAYTTGDKVTHNGKTWISDIDTNTWEPGVYGWTELTE